MIRTRWKEYEKIYLWEYILYIFNFCKHAKIVKFQKNKIKLTAKIWEEENLKPKANSNKWTKEFGVFEVYTIELLTLDYFLKLYCPI